MPISHASVPKNEWKERHCDYCVDVLERKMDFKVFNFHFEAGTLPKVMTKAKYVAGVGVRFLCKRHYGA